MGEDKQYSSLTDHDNLIGLRHDVDALKEKLNCYVPSQCILTSRRLDKIEATLGAWGKFGWILATASVAFVLKVGYDGISWLVTHLPEHI